MNCPSAPANTLAVRVLAAHQARAGRAYAVWCHLMLQESRRFRVKWNMRRMESQSRVCRHKRPRILLSTSVGTYVATVA